MALPPMPLLIFWLFLGSTHANPTPEQGGTSINDPETNPKNFTKDGDRFALLVSIDEYGDPTMASKLSGPKNDMDAMARVLMERYGFPAKQILRLHGERATRKKILEGMAALSDRAAPGRLLVFAFAGHGSYRNDKDDTEEANGKDETICPYDRDLPGGGDILDDELYGFFSAMLDREALLTVIIDACYSGNAAKPLGTDRFRTLPPARGSVTPVSSSKDKGFWVGMLAKRENLVFMASAGEEESAGEGWFFQGDLPEGTYGYFSHALLRALYETPHGRAWEDLRVFLEAEVAKRNLGQQPHFLGLLRRAIFGREVLTDRPRFSVKEVGPIRLGHGLMSGIDEDSIIGIYRPGTARLGGKDGLLGLFRVKEASDHESLAEWMGEDGSPPSISPGDPAVLLVPGNTIGKHRVFWGDGLPKPISDRMQRLLYEDSFFLERGPGNANPTTRDFIIQVQEVDQRNNLSVEGMSSTFTVDLSSTGPSDPSSKLFQHIGNAVRCDRLWRIRNPMPEGFDANEKIQIRIRRGKMKEVEPGSLVLDAEDSMEPDPETGAFRSRIGDALELTYRNKSEKPLYVTVLYLNNEAEISVWNQYQFQGLLQPGKQVTVPENLVRIGPELRPERVKVFVSSSRPFDPQPFLQRSPKGETNFDKIWQDLLLGHVLQKSGEAEMGDEAWGTLEITIKPVP